MSDQKQDRKKLGALWTKNVNGKEMLSGVLEADDGTKTRIVVWPNGYKSSNPKAPDWNIYLDTFEPKPRAADPAPNGDDVPNW